MAATASTWLHRSIRVVSRLIEFVGGSEGENESSGGAFLLLLIHRRGRRAGAMTVLERALQEAGGWATRNRREDPHTDRTASSAQASENRTGSRKVRLRLGMTSTSNRLGVNEKGFAPSPATTSLAWLDPAAVPDFRGVFPNWRPEDLLVFGLGGSWDVLPPAVPLRQPRLMTLEVLIRAGPRNATRQ